MDRTMNPRTIEYYFALASPWSYLGNDRLREIAAAVGPDSADDEDRMQRQHVESAVNRVRHMMIRVERRMPCVRHNGVVERKGSPLVGFGLRNQTQHRAIMSKCGSGSGTDTDRRMRG